MGSRQIVLVSTAGFSVINTGIFWREAKTKRLFSQCTAYLGSSAPGTMREEDDIPGVPLHSDRLQPPANLRALAQLQFPDFL